jgi:hypothetical protein
MDAERLRSKHFAQQYEARNQCKRAVRDGTLVRLRICERCGSDNNGRSLHGHHWHGYDEAHALDVQWLCGSCHSKVHHVIGEQPKGNLTPEQRAARSTRAKNQRRDKHGFCRA